MENVATLRAKTDDAAALLVTHTGWEGNRQRGSSVLYGACDTVLYLKPVARKAEKPPDLEDGEMYLAPVDPPKTRRSRLTVDKHRDAPDEIPGVTYERTDVPGTGSCVYLPVTSGSAKASSNGHGKVVDIRRPPRLSSSNP
jgi:hypothetical protein